MYVSVNVNCNTDINISNLSTVPLSICLLCLTEPCYIVFNSGLQVTMVPLEVTHTAIATQTVLKQLKSGQTGLLPMDLDTLPTTPFRQCVVDLLTFFSDTYKREFSGVPLVDFQDGPPVHDACAVM